LGIRENYSPIFPLSLGPRYPRWDPPGRERLEILGQLGKEALWEGRPKPPNFFGREFLGNFKKAQKFSKLPRNSF